MLGQILLNNLIIGNPDLLRIKLVNWGGRCGGKGYTSHTYWKDALPQHCSGEQLPTRPPLGEQCTSYILDNVDLKVHREERVSTIMLEVV